MACSGKSDRDLILEVLEKISRKNCAVAERHNRPSSAGDFLASSFNEGKKAKVKALKDSFHPEIINLIETTLRKARKPPSDEQDEGEQTTQSISSPQKKGKEIHLSLANRINEDRRDGTGGKMLKKIEEKFSCKFIKAEVTIFGYAVKTRDFNGKLTQDFWSGVMDAVAIRRNKKGVLEVFVVDWKTSAKADEQLMNKWWENAGNFKNPLYQCLVYRELLQAHFKRNKVDAVVGIILVPFCQSLPHIIRPGLCVDFGRMEKLLLHRLKEYEWSDESFDVHTIKMPCKLIKDSFDPVHYVDESTNILKDDTLLKDMLHDDATYGDLRRLLRLPWIKIESIKKEEKTNEELEEEAETVASQCLEFVQGPLGQLDDGLSEEQGRNEQNRQVKFNPPLGTMTVASTSSLRSVTATWPSGPGVNVMTTPRLTSTVAPIPYPPYHNLHTIPSQLDGVSQSPPVNFCHVAQGQQLEAPHQPPIPMPGMQGTVTSLARPRNVAPASSRSLSTEIVHPQTSFSSTCERVSQESSTLGYSTQNAYHNGEPGSRFPVASWVSQRPQQRRQIPQGVGHQISPSPTYVADANTTEPRTEHQPVPRPHHPVP